MRPGSYTMQNLFQIILPKFCALLILVFIGSVSSNAVGQDWAKKMFNELSHDFGTVNKEERPVHKFQIKNIYNETITITNLRSSCGCTSVSIDKRTLKTGEVAELTAKYNSHIFDGFKQATITVSFGAPFYGEAILQVKGNIVRGVTINPRNLEFGEINSGNPPSKVIQISKSGDPNFRIVDIKSTFPHISVQLQQTARTRNFVNYQVTASLNNETIPKGFSQGELLLITTDSSRVLTENKIKFTARVVSPLQLSPQTLTLGSVKPGEKVTKKVIIKAGQPFRIVDVTCLNTSFRVRAKSDSKKVHIVEVSYTGSEDQTGKFESELNFITDLGGKTTGSIKAIVESNSESVVSTDK